MLYIVFAIIRTIYPIKMIIKPFAKTLSTRAEYKSALKSIATLVDKGDGTTAEEDAYLELL